MSGTENEFEIPGLNNTLRDRCIALWTVLNEQAVGQNAEGIEPLYWTGKISEVYVTAGIPIGSSKTIVKHLVELGCISYVQRGNSAQPTILRLGSDPAAMDWIPPERNNDGSDLTGSGRLAILARTVQDIKDQLGGLDLRKAFGALNQQIAEQALEIENLTKRLDALNGENEAGKG